ncbi:unnamed protein product [Nezara viridula]|uniref:Uncharacterized protein n=1 Tax=Nezara viridula TaxID=85310 RepID=A0A9P0HM13_NEZVI|nr:unnamed protein product [Nezara viridula]
MVTESRGTTHRRRRPPRTTIKLPLNNSDIKGKINIAAMKPAIKGLISLVCKQVDTCPRARHGILSTSCQPSLGNNFTIM